MAYLNLEDTTAYQQWADRKRASYSRLKDEFPPIVEVDRNGRVGQASLSIIHQQITNFNFALYKIPEAGADHLQAVKNLGKAMGLKELDANLCAHEDKITRLTVDRRGRKKQYIPYSNKAIGWHTDGYYNPFHQRVLGLVLHCEHSAAEGGVNDLLDHEMAYIHLRDENPGYIRALSCPDVMCIPENIEEGIEIRPQTCSAVFIREQGPRHSPYLSMRFSNRKRNIIWPDDALTQEALDCLRTFLDSASPYHIRYRLKAGEGVISNNVLHTRSAFTDSDENKRIYYRARYYNRINCS